ncbi:DNA polymerase beta superfamily protein [Salinilacihabitans rarus]|uniref:DNA polymerase beta superfamily protein n=1 Tax=Salinilacihabitans rarus TaxID=2961596 RepID=UPI0020C87E4B|nr:nucleotidyltransferase domain-containing protein [Salinilacihabitans rarus]
MTVPEVESALERAAERRDLTILAARDVGSRAWNLADENSDYDVAVVFVQEPTAYATVGEYVESVAGEREPVELHGWNVSRFAELLVDSNPAAFEFLHSPRRYREFEPLSALERDVGYQFEPSALYYHYRSLANRQYRKYLHGRLLEGGDLAYLIEEEGDGRVIARRPDDPPTDAHLREVDPSSYERGRTDRTVRRNLYVARAVLYARYVRDIHRFPTLDFPAFLEHEGDRFDDSFVERARDLVERKRAGEGDETVGRVFEPSEVALPEIDPEDHATGGVDRERVNDFVRAAFDATSIGR